MYAFVDQPVARLTHGSRFTLWAMRAWIHAMEKRRCPPAALAPAFAKMEVLPAIPDLQIVMVLMNRDALDQRNFGAIDCGNIHEDEALMLGLWRDVAIGAAEHARATLALLVAEEAIEPILRAMTEMTAKLTAAELSPIGVAPYPQETFGHE